MLERTILLDGHSKTYAMTGWRLGYGIMPKELAAAVAKLQTNCTSCTASFTQIAGAEALTGPQDAARAMVAEFKARRDLLVDGLNAIEGISCKRPRGAFYVFPNITGLGLTSKQVEQRLLDDYGVAALAGTSFGKFGEGYLRFSYANSQENIRKALERFGEFAAAVSQWLSGGRRYVIALGGNAIIPAGAQGTFAEQLGITRATMAQVARLAAAGHEVVLTHGNGPVVGNIVLRGDAGQAVHGIPAMPMFVCGADSQGGLGFMLQQALQNELRRAGLDTPVATVVTQVAGRPRRPRLRQAHQAHRSLLRRGAGRAPAPGERLAVVKDAGRGWRRVVPSPQPIEVIEWEAIRILLDAGVVTVAVGGGGIPVVRRADGDLEGVDAVIDKDRASDLLGRLVGPTCW